MTEKYTFPQESVVHWTTYVYSLRSQYKYLCCTAHYKRRVVVCTGCLSPRPAGRFYSAQIKHILCLPCWTCLMRYIQYFYKILVVEEATHKTLKTKCRRDKCFKGLDGCKNVLRGESVGWIAINTRLSYQQEMYAANAKALLKRRFFCKTSRGLIVQDKETSQHSWFCLLFLFFNSWRFKCFSCTLLLATHFSLKAPQRGSCTKTLRATVNALQGSTMQRQWWCFSIWCYLDVSWTPQGAANTRFTVALWNIITHRCGVLQGVKIITGVKPQLMKCFSTICTAWNRRIFESVLNTELLWNG